MSFIGQFNSSQLAVADVIFEYFSPTDRLGRIGAFGFLGSIQQESRFNVKARGDGGLAYGLAQMHPDRIKLIREGSPDHIDIAAMPPALQQCQGMWWELQHSETEALRMIREARTAYAAGAAACKYYERPAERAAQEAIRGKNAEGWQSYYNSKAGA